MTFDICDSSVEELLFIPLAAGLLGVRHNRVERVLLGHVLPGGGGALEVLGGHTSSSSVMCWAGAGGRSGCIASQATHCSRTGPSGSFFQCQKLLAPHCTQRR